MMLPPSERLQAERDDLRYRLACQVKDAIALTEAVRDLDAEIARHHNDFGRIRDLLDELEDQDSYLEDRYICGWVKRARNVVG